MVEPTPPEVRQLTDAEVDGAARLLDDFNREFDTPTPGRQVLAERLRRHLDDTSSMVLLAGRPAIGIAVVSFRPNVWFDGPVALLDELYVAPDRRNNGIGSHLLAALADACRGRRVELIEINVDIGDTDARRFYERHGYSAIEPDTGEHALYYHRRVEL